MTLTEAYEEALSLQNNTTFSSEQNGLVTTAAEQLGTARPVEIGRGSGGDGLFLEDLHRAMKLLLRKQEPRKIRIERRDQRRRVRIYRLVFGGRRMERNGFGGGHWQSLSECEGAGWAGFRPRSKRKRGCI